MVKVRVTGQGIIEESGDGFDCETSLTYLGSAAFSGSVNVNAAFSASQGLMAKSPSSGTTGPYFSLVVTASEGSSSAFNGILIHGTGSNVNGGSVGTNGGLGLSMPAGAGLLFFDPYFQPIGGSVTGALKLKIGSTVRVLSMSTI